MALMVIIINFQQLIPDSLPIGQKIYISFWVICPNHLGDMPQLLVDLTEAFFHKIAISICN
jgi:hypothetical protein